MSRGMSVAQKVIVGVLVVAVGGVLVVVGRDMLRHGVAGSGAGATTPGAGAGAASAGSGGGLGANGSGGASRASTIDPAKAQEIMQAAASLVQSGQQEQAETVLRQASMEHPEEAAFHLAYAEALMRRKANAEAYEAMLRALAVGERDAKAEYTAGVLAGSLGRHERAEEHFHAAQTADPTRAEYPLFLGQSQLRLNKLDEAKASLLRAGALEPERAVVWGMLGEIALRENNPRIALQHIGRARALEPNVTAWRLIEARGHNRVGAPEQALAVLQGLPDAERLTSPVALLAAESLGLLGKRAEAAAWVRAAADAAPTDPALTMQAAAWLERAGDVEGARRYARHAAMLGDDAGRKMAERLAGAGAGEGPGEDKAGGR